MLSQNMLAPYFLRLTCEVVLQLMLKNKIGTYISISLVTNTGVIYPCCVGVIYPCSVGLMDLPCIRVCQRVHVVKAIGSKICLFCDVLKIVLQKLR